MNEKKTMILIVDNLSRNQGTYYCEHIFEVTYKRQRFCPPLPNKKRSSCEMAYNNRLKKERKLKGEI